MLGDMKTPSESVRTARDAFNTGKTKSLAFRKQQLKALLKMYEDNQDDMINALHKDLRKPKQEAVLTEVDFLMNDVRYILAGFKSWARPRKAKRRLMNLLEKFEIHHDPYGVVLVIGSWNYPLQIALQPVAGAISAGNCVIIKPSEISPNTSQLISKLLPKYLDEQCYQVILGGIAETTSLLQEKFDYIFFTGSPAVGKIVHAAASKNLTPTTLELGGKSPVYLEKISRMRVAARRILWGKCTNAGQTCIAPDYIICTKETESAFVEHAKAVLNEFYPESAKASPDFGRIISEQHFARLSKLLATCKVALGGKTEPSGWFIEPTVVTNVKESDPIMQEEIFGPILPIINVNSAEEAVKFVNSREKPLALYIFSENKATVRFILNNTSSGGVCVNDTLMHVTPETLPFGGVGNSGMGCYHGKFSFDTFSHRKSVLSKGLCRVQEKLLYSSRYPPYTEYKLRTLRVALKHRNCISCGYLKYVLVFLLGVVVATFGCYYLHVYYEH